MQVWLRCDFIRSRNRPTLDFLAQLFECFDQNRETINHLMKVKEYLYCDRKLLAHIEWNKKSYNDLDMFSVELKRYYGIKYISKGKDNILMTNELHIRSIGSVHKTFPYRVTGSILSIGCYRIYKNKVYKLIPNETLEFFPYNNQIMIKE